jgi:hypothetical protein
VTQEELDREATGLAQLAIEASRKHGVRFTIVLIDPSGAPAKMTVASNCSPAQLRVIAGQLENAKEPDEFVRVPRAGSS